MANALDDLAAAQVSVWLDDLSRPRIHDRQPGPHGRQREIVGITTNPTIFAKAIGAGSGYEDQLRDLALRGTAIGETLRLLTAWDVRAACDIMRPAYDRSAGRDGRVSIEVDPRIPTTPTAPPPRRADCGGWSTGPTCSSRFPRHWPVCRQSRPLSDGISVNVTLIFSVERYGRCSTRSSPAWSSAGGRRQPGRYRERGFVLHQPRRYRGGPAARPDAVQVRQGRQGADRLRGQAAVANAAWPMKYTNRCWYRPAGRRWRQRGQSAAAALGVDRGKGQGVQRHPLRHRTGGARHGQHHARSDAARRRRPWRNQG